MSSHGREWASNLRLITALGQLPGLCRFGEVKSRVEEDEGRVKGGETRFAEASHARTKFFWAVILNGVGGRVGSEGSQVAQMLDESNFCFRILRSFAVFAASG